MNKDTVSHQDIAAPLVLVGSRLKKARLEQGVELEKIASKTQINLKHLIAIEAGQEDSLPEQIYIRGFIRKYAQVLGLDSVALEQEFLSPDTKGKRGSRRLNKSKSRNPLQVYGIPQKIQYSIYGFLVLVAGCGLVFLNNSNFSAEPVQSSISESVANK